MTPDYAKTVVDALRAAIPPFDATLEVDDDYVPEAGSPVLLVADDGDTPSVPGAFTALVAPRVATLRLTGIARGRTEARLTVIDAARYVVEHRPGLSRVQDVPGALITRDPETGAYLASIAMPVIVRQSA